MSKDQTLAEYLNEIGASRDVVQQGLRYYLAKRTDYLPQQDMREQMVAAARDGAAIDAELLALSRSSERLEQVVLAVLAEAWADADERERVRASLAAANKSLPLIEGLALATAAMFGLYLLVTQSKREAIAPVERAADGSFTEQATAAGARWQQQELELFPTEDAEAARDA